MMSLRGFWIGKIIMTANSERIIFYFFKLATHYAYKYSSLIVVLLRMTSGQATSKVKFDRRRAAMDSDDDDDLDDL